MFLHRLDLTTALRPELLPDETLLFVQDAVGLYEGKYKIPDYQDGHAYLTSHRVCYVDNKEPRKFSVAVNLKDVERPEFYAGFLKSSPKVTVYPKPNKRPNLAATRSPAPLSDKRADVNHSPIHRNDSPAPVLSGAPIGDDVPECIKFSFRVGGEKIFFERLKGALLQRKWLLQSAPPIPKPIESSTPSQSPGDLPIRNKAVGIGGLERRGIEQRQNNEIMIGSAFEDLEALMTSAKEIIALAEQFASQANLNGNGNSEADAALAQSASALGLVTTKDMLGSGSDTLYISELSRNLAEFLTDDRKGILKREGGIMSLVDLWAVFNRARGGVELVSPTDFEKAAQIWDKLKLPIRLRRFKSGLLVVQGRDRTDEKTIASLVSWLQELHTAAPPGEAGWDWETYGRGVTAQEAAEWFGWSVGVATEELEMAEEKGVLCREQGLDGIKFWENWIVKLPRVEDAVVAE
ncbi:Vacuolar protein-sorting-associated protein 36 [Diplodia seriata]